MPHLELQTERLRLRLQTPKEVLSWIDSLGPEVQSEISPVWLARVQSLTEPDAWCCVFDIIRTESENVVGQCGFKGPPDSHNSVEIAYGIEREFQNQGIATEATQSLVGYAFSTGQVCTVLAHTKSDNIASERVLQKSGFQYVGEHFDPEDGLVNRWTLARG